MPSQCIAKTKEALKAACEEFGYPLVIKINSPDILHKAKAGGVRLNIQSLEESHENPKKLTGSMAPSCLPRFEELQVRKDVIKTCAISFASIVSSIGIMISAAGAAGMLFGPLAAGVIVDSGHPVAGFKGHSQIPRKGPQFRVVHKRFT